MKLAFIIQGEGRGHMSQALAFNEIIAGTRHEVALVMVGTSPQRKVPDYFKNGFRLPVVPFRSPNFLQKKNKKGIRIYASIIYNFLNGFRYVHSIFQLNKEIKTSKADLIINFYDPLAGLYNWLFRPKARFYVIAHHFMILHPSFNPPKKFPVQRLYLRILNWLVSLGAEKRLCLSFSEIPDVPSRRLYIIPPILRKNVFNSVPRKKDYIVAYLLNPGYFDELVRWHNENKDIKIHVFWDKPNVPDPLIINKNLYFHQPDDLQFIQYLSGSMAYVSTAGFESICEAMYLEKPVMMIPTENHYEQESNAVDAKKNGAGIISNSFNPGLLITYLPNHKNDYRSFKNWVAFGKEKINEEIGL